MLYKFLALDTERGRKVDEIDVINGFFESAKAQNPFISESLQPNEI